MKECKFCKKELQDNDIKCDYCEKPQEEELVNDDKTKEKELKGIGGWLAFLAIGIVITPIQTILIIWSLFITQINDGTFYSLTNALSPIYIEGYFPIFLFEIFGNILTVVLAIILLYFFFNKNKIFPLFFKIFVIYNFVFVLSDYFIADLIPEVAQIDDNFESLKELFRSLVYMVVWGSYIHVSKRVKNTFTNENYESKSVGLIVSTTILVLFLLGALIQIDYKAFTGSNIPEYKLAEGEVAKNSTGIYNINSFYSIDINKDYSFISNIKELNEEASIGFKSKNGTYTMIIPEIIDEETKEYFSTTSEEELLESLAGVFNESFGLNINSKKVNYSLSNTFYEFKGSANIEGLDMYYHILFTINDYEGLNIYTYGYSKDVVNSEGKKFLENMKRK